MIPSSAQDFMKKMFLILGFFFSQVIRRL